ncbi:MAG: DUF4988 domain-containing protein [Helicobacter trogontum]|uniref:Periplasmic protein n=1 Tax=Helicobacter trogontum TaxID=50960 RepID=A0ABQ0D660_9HELI|nr:hypothetical protein [Helicobacter trogontum]MCI5786158.1 DUF4988 domain-containing protein [Helicobacter trogontum]
MKTCRICIAILLLCNILVANELQQKIQKLITKSSYQANEKFINKIFANEKSFYQDNNLNVVKVLSVLKNNGLLSLKLAKPSNVSVTFRLNSLKQTDRDPSFTFLAYSASNILSSIGYSYFYVTQATKEDKEITLTYTLNAESNVDPIVMTANLVKRGYKIIDVNRYSATHWVYDISLINSNIVAAKFLAKGTNTLTQINGKYWLTFANPGTIQITPQDNTEAWYPKILIFDNAMNPLHAIMLTDSKTTYQIDLPQSARHVLVTDNYNATILRNGINIDFTPK